MSKRTWTALHPGTPHATGKPGARGELTGDPACSRAPELRAPARELGGNNLPNSPDPYCSGWAPGMSRDWQGAPLQPLKNNGFNFVDFSRQQYVQDVLEVIEGPDGG